LTKIEFLYDFASPNCYVALHKLKKVAEVHQFELVLKPIFLGGLFQMTKDGPVPRGSLEYNYMVKNLQRISKVLDVEFNFPHSLFPVNSLRALRGSYFAESHEKAQEYVTRVFGEHWGRGLDISDPLTLGRIVKSFGFNGNEFSEYIGREETKLRLRRDTQEAYERGVFGTPTFFVDGEMFWGTPEILWFLEKRLAES
jgi:2-hydroxychromene-2-carboxylate isomerase